MFVDLVEAGEFDRTKFFEKKTTSAWHVTSKVEPGHGVNANHQVVERLHIDNTHDDAGSLAPQPTTNH